MPEPVHQTRPAAFRGSLVLNQRSIRTALEAVNDEKLRQSDKAVALPELVNLCLLLECIAFSNDLYVDGTLPPADIALIEYEVLKAAEKTGRRFAVAQIRRDTGELVTLFQESAETAALLIEQSLRDVSAQKDEPLAGDVSDFVKTVVGGAADSRSSRVARALEIADAASGGRDMFRGSKCAAGILLAEADGVDLLETVAPHLRDATPSGASKLVAILINRFRINYVNSLASTKKAAYLADISIEDLKSAQIVLYWRYLARKLSEKHKLELTPATKDAFDKKLAAAPLGFAILMNTMGDDPHSLLHEAFEIRNRRLARQAANSTAQDRYMHEMDEEAFGDFQDYLYKSKWMQLHNRSEREKFEVCWWRQMNLPAALGAGIGGFVGALFHFPVIAGLSHLGGEVLGEAFDFATDHALKAGKIHVDQYRKLDGYLHLAAQNDRMGSSLSEQVKRLLGRPLGAL